MEWFQYSFDKCVLFWSADQNKRRAQSTSRGTQKQQSDGNNNGGTVGWKYTRLIVYFRPRYGPSATQRNEATP